MSHPNSPAPPLAEPPVVAERSMLGRWLGLALGLVALGVGLTALVKNLPTEDSVGAGRPFLPLAPEVKGPPGKVSLSEDSVHRFGVLPQQTTGSHTWEFKNEGEGDLILSKGESTCSCTIANFKDDQKSFTLKPGQSTQITLTWETREFDGEYKKSADINVLNDPTREYIRFEVVGTVRPAVAVMPKERVLNLGTIESSEETKAHFAVASADKPDLKLVALTSTRPDAIDLEVVPLPDADRRALEWTAMPGGHLVKVKLKPSNELGVFNEEVVVTTDHPLLKEIKVSVGGRRVGPISTAPDAARLYRVDSDEGGSTAVMILVRNAPDTRLEVLEQPESLKVEIVPVDVKTGTAAKVRQYRLVVTVPPGTPPKVIDGLIVLKTDHPHAAQVRIPVDITVLEGK